MNDRTFPKEKEQRLKRTLRSLVKKSKCLKGANIVEFPFDKFKKSHLIQMVKSFYRIEDLTVFWDHLQPKTIRTNIYWLTHLRQLKTLRIKNSQSSYRYSHLNFKHLNQKFFKALKRKKLQKFKFLLGIGPEDVSEGLMISNYPSTLKELTLSLDRSQLDPIQYFSFQNYFSLSQISHLQKLELLFPIPLQLLNNLLSSIANPIELTCLGLQLADRNLPGENDISLLTNFLQKCTHLKELNLKFYLWIDIFTKLTPLQPFQLKSLNLTVQIDEEIHLTTLGSFLKNFSQLQKLKLLILNSSWSNSFQEGFVIFNQDLAKLTELKKFDVYFWLLGSTPTSKTPGVLSNLANCVNSLTQLEELYLNHTEADFENELFILTDALRGKSSQLKRLRLEFKAEKLKEQDVINFIKTIQKFEKLEELEFKGLSLINAEIFELFSKIICNSKKLRILNLKKLSTPGASGWNILSMLKEILLRPGFESICYEEPWNSSANLRFAECQKLNMKEIVEKNSRLKSVSLPSYMFQGHFYPKLIQYKWT